MHSRIAFQTMVLLCAMPKFPVTSLQSSKGSKLNHSLFYDLKLSINIIKNMDGMSAHHWSVTPTILLYQCQVSPEICCSEALRTMRRAVREVEIKHSLPTISFTKTNKKNNNNNKKLTHLKLTAVTTERAQMFCFWAMSGHMLLHHATRYIFFTTV